MVSARVIRLSVVMILVVAAIAANAATDQVTVSTGKLQGTANADGTVRMFKGVPFAAPPVGDLRWKAPQPAIKWDGVRAADKFGSACLQTDVFGDIYFRDAQPSEDCLNLDIWIPAKAASSKLPVLVWFYGGGFVAGSASEPRYDGETLAKKGIIVVNPELSPRVVRIFCAPGVDQGIAESRIGQLWPAGPGGCARVGGEEHCCVWWRSEKHHHCRRVGGIVFGERAHGITVVEELVPESNGRERRIFSQHHDRRTCS